MVPVITSVVKAQPPRVLGKADESKVASSVKVVDLLETNMARMAGLGLRWRSWFAAGACTTELPQSQA
eukprot:CAMPEP_0184506312 /NCGR_PEP_ID=MMETSP0113_2-20130426/53433_1 /TAXON_ID=91329 /ORGANISM="Norrisiella sphaerica, Strain BC52" /LENGTH=67 /DNA_ID=CAMNT_0026896025 /DNA_START=711 /DNA_END=914 /DNA_ORIENTATION=+